MAKLYNASLANSLCFQLFYFGVFPESVSLLINCLFTHFWNLSKRWFQRVCLIMNPCKLSSLQFSLSWSPSNLWRVAGEIINLGIFLSLSPMSFVWVSLYRTLWIVSHYPRSLCLLWVCEPPSYSDNFSFSNWRVIKEFLEISVCNSGNCPVSWILTPLRTLSNVFSFFLRKWTRSAAVCEDERMLVIE